MELDSDTIKSETKSIPSPGVQSKFLKLAIEIETENNELKAKVKVLEDEVSKYKKRVEVLEEKLKDVDPGLECVGGSFAEINKKSTIKVIYWYQCVDKGFL